MGSINMNWNMLVADVTDTLILGLDFLEGNKVVIDHGQFNKVINQGLIPASYTSNDENKDIQDDNDSSVETKCRNKPEFTTKDIYCHSTVTKLRRNSDTQCIAPGQTRISSIDKEPNRQENYIKRKPTIWCRH
jgi:hypothetical protein